MKSDIQILSVDQLLQRIGAQPFGNIWSAVITIPSDFDKAIIELNDMLTIFIESEIGILSAEQGVENLIERISCTVQNYLLLRDFELWQKKDWEKFDSLRSWLGKEKYGGMLILSLQAAKSMINYAPNFTSWLGARVFQLVLGTELLTESEREERLSALREWSGETDADVIDLAEKKQLPSDPEYGEWLILLNREDLIGR